ncbi:hypothetical protein L596_019170 [Steinernema carpocapsae]|uniref:Uncharacterized protein n=1 Tax=Steinernema carpocapsae TaxID=34508 RepID=A0A4V6A2A3_STECR|nr:hypothetical protein L596_019170 [Steinernema carpocapsae]
MSQSALSPKKRSIAKSAPASAAKDDLDSIQVKKRVKLSDSSETTKPKPPAYDFPKWTVKDFLCSEDEQLKTTVTDEMMNIFAVESQALMAELKDVLAKGESSDGKESLGESYDKCQDHVFKMRYAHRMNLLKTEEGNEAFFLERNQIDKEFRAKGAARVRLYNVRNEIETCLDIRAPEEECELIPLAEFLERAPSANIPGNVPNKKHQERIARLQWEVEERTAQLEKLQELENRRDVLVTDIGGKESRIASMKPIFEKMREAAKPLYDLVGPSTNYEVIAEHCRKFFNSIPMITAGVGSPQPEPECSGDKELDAKIEEEEAESDGGSGTTVDDEDAGSPENVAKEEDSDGDPPKDIDEEIFEVDRTSADSDPEPEQEKQESSKEEPK